MSSFWEPLSTEIPSLLSYLFLGVAILCNRFSKNSAYWLNALGISAILGVALQRIAYLAALEGAILSVTLYFGFRNRTTTFRALFKVLALMISAVICLRVFPGFNNLKLISNAQISSDAIPYSFWLNYDKPLVGLLILAFGSFPILGTWKQWKKSLRQSLPWSLIGIVVTIFAANLIGYLHFDPKLSAYFLYFVPINLLFTCVGEEAIFRGLIQKELSSQFSKKTWGRWVALAIASLSFGLVHYAGGLQYVLLASIAGIFYGLVYEKTKSIECAILAHFALNAAHFLLFTYPALKI